jgi:hypothetical protein
MKSIRQEHVKEEKKKRIVHNKLDLLKEEERLALLKEEEKGFGVTKERSKKKRNWKRVAILSRKP